MYKNCRHRLKHRARPVGGKRIVIPNRVSISERSKEVDGVRFGDFEMDTIVGKGNCGAIVTLVEKQTNMLFMRKLKHGKNAKKLAETVKQLLMPKIKSITTDNGMEFAAHEIISKSLGGYQCILLIRIPHGKRGLLRMQTDSLGSTFLSLLRFQTSVNRK